MILHLSWVEATSLKSDSWRASSNSLTFLSLVFSGTMPKSYKKVYIIIQSSYSIRYDVIKYSLNC